MKAIIVNEDSTLQTQELEMPVIENPQQIIVKIAYSGLCGSDIPRIFHHGAHFYPITLGHEFSGTIVEVGQHVEHLKVGDNIASVPLLPCFKCDECHHHYYSLCKNYTFVGSRKAGGFAEYVVMDQKNAFKLPNNVSLLAGAFFEPLTVGMHGILLADGCQDKNVIIVGAGTIGLLAMQCAKAMGASSIIVIDINQERLALAKSLGADHVYNPSHLTAEQILDAMNDLRFNQLVLETAGSPITVKLSIDIAGPRAQLVLIGTLHQDLALPEKTFGLILRKELTIMGSWMNYSAPWPGKEWQLISDYFAQGKIELEKLIAGIGGADEFIKMVTDLHGKSMSGKLLLRMEN
ncbi:galactitol 1-phosphate 5-dehydrogenase [Orbus hercynius]|uniref:Galactitol 1-phosphate 5-dehydrogenase n=1 Tax=Orbus hercynius TaxID=593135 RepID=A0A495RC03_9GAMM|nr:alcohol dehydrogenase catalytic domain-containing protein [Orbus hercynius]RKS84790.1 galactitol 1-phosphate 5-dehydrogenase [Orbus hercynius]